MIETRITITEVLIEVLTDDLDGIEEVVTKILVTEIDEEVHIPHGILTETKTEVVHKEEGEETKIGHEVEVEILSRIEEVLIKVPGGLLLEAAIERLIETKIDASNAMSTVIGREIVRTNRRR
jgi:hypothetical protein